MAAGEKRLKHIDDSLPKASIVLVDIEGTTTSISFVKDTLFPYIRSNLESYLKAHWNDAEFQDDLLLLKEQAKQDEADKVDGVVVIPENNEDTAVEAVVRNVLWQMDLDRKTKALKQLQGHIMREGYKNGTLKGHVYSDVVPALKSWAHSGRQIYVYSSGSVEAQKLLFGHSEEGDLLELFAGHFDTSVGPKVESTSYINIVKKLECKSEDVLFLTDVPKEAKAAEEAGLNAVLVVREGNEPLTEEDKMRFPVIRSFQDFVFETSAKRKKMSTDDEPHVTVESPANEASNSDNAKTEVASTESAGSGNTESSLSELEMMDVSSNDPQETNVKSGRTETESQSTDINMATEGGVTKESGKTGLATNGSEVCKPKSSPPELKTVEAPDTKEESPKAAEEYDSGNMSETADVKLKSTEVDVEVPKVQADTELKDTKTDAKECERDIESAKAGNTDVDINKIPASVEVEKVDSAEVGNAESSARDTNIEVKAARNDPGSGSAIVDSEKLETDSGNTKTNFDNATADADGDTEKNIEAEADSSHEEADSQGAKADTQNTKVVDSKVGENINTEISEVNVDSTETEGKMGADSSEIKECGVVNAGDAEGAEVMDTENISIQMKAEVSREMEVESLAKFGEKDEALRKVTDVKSGENASVKEEGEGSELSEDLLVNKDDDVTKLKSEATGKTESDITLHQLQEKHSVNDSPADDRVLGDNKPLEITEAERSKSTAELNTESPATDTSREESSELKPAADKILQGKMEDVSNTVENADSEIPVTVSNVDRAEADTNANEDIKPVELKNVEVKGADESSAVEDTTKENGLPATAENGNCPDSGQNGEVQDVEHDVMVKKLSMDDSGNKDDATLITSVASS